MKIPAKALLNIDPDKLFEDLTIQEIEETQKKLQHEIERKKEELRTMVGERYRDLIEAADTISEMKVLSDSVIKDIEDMSSTTSSLQQKQVSGFKLDNSNGKVRSLTQNQSRRMAVQIKLLIEISELIWSAIDCHNFTQATLLYSLARHVKTSLEMDNIKGTTSFSVVTHQWASMVHFKETILNGSEEVLKTQHLSSNDACSCLFSIVLLQSYDSSQLLERFLSLRSEALKSVLSFKEQSPDSNSVKQCLFDSHSLIVNSLVALCHCFIESPEASEGLMWKHLNNYTGINAYPTLNIMDLQEFDIPKTFISPIVADFRPQTSSELKNVTAKEMTSVVSNWLTWVQDFVNNKGGELLTLLSSLRSLQGLRDTVQTLPEEWPLVLQKLSLKQSQNFWTELYRPLIIRRAILLVEVHWDTAINDVEVEVTKAVDDALLEGKQSELDLRWYVWKENPNDLGLKTNSSESKRSKGLWLKSKGISPRVAELCEILEGKLTTLVNDLATLCSDREVDPTVLSDIQTLKNHQQTVCAAALARIVAFVQKELEVREPNEITSILLARFLQSLPELCPSLHKCLSATESKTISWQEICNNLNSEVLSVYQTWLDLVKARLVKDIQDKLKQPSSLTDLLKFTPQWELVCIEEGDESGEILKSELRVPSSPSFCLQAILNSVSAFVGHSSVPKQVCELLIDSLVPHIVSCYKPDLQTSTTQSQYLQHLLDVKYVTYLLVAPHKKVLQTQAQDIIAEIEGRVDPFDLNVFLPYVDDNVKRSVQRTQALLGVISATHNVSAVLNTKTEEPSVLAMSITASTTWFPMLHITAPYSARPAQPANKPKGIKKSTSTPTLESNNENSARQTAASFFGAMATDWFG